MKSLQIIGLVGVIFLTLIIFVWLTNYYSEENPNAREATATLQRAQDGFKTTGDMLTGCNNDECRRRYWRIYN